MRPERTRRARRGLTIAGALALPALLAGAALAAGALHLGSTQSAALGKPVLSNPAGRTLYTLSSESGRHLLCSSKQCLALWPPLTVSSAHAKVTVPGSVHGKLGVVKRGRAWQVTLAGRPVYRYSGDSGSGQTRGEGLRLAGGVWHAITAASPASSPAPQPAPPAESSPYGY